jgi:hypothetical protein
MQRVSRKTVTFQYQSPDGVTRTFQLENPFTNAKTGDEVSIVADFSNRIPFVALEGWADIQVGLLTVSVLFVVFAGGTFVFWLIKKRALRP